jgi:hypothetical protein
MANAKKIEGGYWRGPNRWHDAGYADKAPPAVTQVYFFLCHWARNETWVVEQTIGAIRRKSGVRSERYVRGALKILEAWGVITQVNTGYQNQPKRYQLNDLAERAPRCPKEAAEMTSAAPSQSVGASGSGQKLAGGQNSASTPSPTAGAPSVGRPSAGTPSAPPYQTGGYQTGVNHTAPIISSSGTEAPTDDTNAVGEATSPSAFERATPMPDDPHEEGMSEEEGAWTQLERKELVRDARRVLAGHGHNYLLSDEQAHRIYRGEPLREVLDDDQMDIWETSLDEIPF